MMVHVKGPVPQELTEATRIRVALPFYQWATIVAAIFVCGGYLANLNMRFNKAESNISHDSRRLDYHTAILISKGLMSPEDLMSKE